MTVPRADALLRWYAPRASLYPWRRRPTPYRVLVSEVMLQQTQAARVAPAFRRFLRRFPSVAALAAAPKSDVVRAWAGLGYNRRAVALSEAARAIVREHGGRVPRDLESLRGLPGVGPYTASAVAALAFGEPVVAVDTNVRRVVARACLGTEASSACPDDLRSPAEAWLEGSDPAAWNQAVMDLGREVCRPEPRCEVCPISTACLFRRRGEVRASRRTRRAPAFEGSRRQLRGRIVSVLRASDAAAIEELLASTEAPMEAVADAVDALVRDGLVSRAPSGRLRLAP